MCCPFGLAKYFSNATTLIIPAIPATAAGLDNNAAGSMAIVLITCEGIDKTSQLSKQLRSDNVIDGLLNVKSILYSAWKL